MSTKRTYAGIPLGVTVRRQIGHEYIFRVRRGNGHQGAKLGVTYQDKYAYVVPDSIANAEGEPARANLRAAVDYWKNILTDEQKATYNARVSKLKGLSGYNLFIREALKGEFSMFVDRGDPSGYDFDKDDLTLDGAWHDLDLSAIVPSTARAVLIAGHVEGVGADWAIQFKKYGQSNDINHGGMETLRAGVERHRSAIVATDNNRKIQYKADNESWDALDLTVRGWWT